MMKKIDEQTIDKQIYTETQIRYLLEDAVWTERFISKPNNSRVPAMYKIIECSYDEQDYGYYIASYKGKATPKQMTRYNFAVEVMLMVKSDVDVDPVFARKLIWLKANRYPMTKLAKMFGYHRTTLKIRYQTILQRLADKINSTYSFDSIDKFLYKF